MSWVKTIDIAGFVRDSHAVLGYQNEFRVWDLVLSAIGQMQGEWTEAASEASLNVFNVHGYCLHLTCRRVKPTFSSSSVSGTTRIIGVHGNQPVKHVWPTTSLVKALALGSRDNKPTADTPVS